MTLDHLWAGWRNAYVSSLTSPVSGEGEVGAPMPDVPEGCVLCRIDASGLPSADNGVVARRERCVTLLNAYPYAPGHVLVMPRRHVGSLAELDGEERRDLWEMVGDAVRCIEAAYAPEGLNVGANLGAAAGAGIPRHLHVHALPRWAGDTNFMTAVAGARVLPEALPDTWAKLRDAWPA
ncbi:MAG: HIT domain-containing protein [Actinomycetota bacterium]|jgi:ATP adenylyltransferase|nr:HIT domain-containing protein [Actinomycetota bacterium]